MTASGAGAGPSSAAPGGRGERALLLLGVVTLAVSLRPAVTSLGAVLGMVRDELEQLMHLWALNRGVLLTPFHNMALFSPAHAEADVDRHTEVFAEAVGALAGATA